MTVKTLLLTTVVLLAAGGGVTAQDDWDDDELPFDDLPVVEGVGVTVTASQETTGQTRVISRDEIERARARDLAALLQETAGIGVTRYGGYGGPAEINMRGFDSSRVAFLVNGVPVNSVMDGGFDINTIDLGAVERIEVIQGGADTRFNVSGALGGVINIVTVGTARPGPRVSASLSNTAALPGRYRGRDGAINDPAWEDLVDAQNVRGSLTWGGGAGDFSASLFANRAANHYLFHDDIFNRVSRRENSEVYDAGGSVSYVRRFDDLSRIIVSGGAYYADKNVPTSFTSPDAAKQNDVSCRESALFDMPRAFRDDVSMEASLSHGFQRLDYEPAATAASRHDQSAVSAVNRWTWFASNSLTFRAGGDARFAWLDSTELGRRDRLDGGVDAAAEWTAAPGLLVTAALKGVFAPGAAVPVPKLGLRWDPLDALTIKANGYRGFKLPDFQDLYWSGAQQRGNPDLRPEDGWGADLSAAYETGARVDAVVELGGFFQWTENSIHWAAAADGTWAPQNIAKAALMGVDARAGVTLPGFAFFAPPRVDFLYRYLLTYLLAYGYTWSDNKRIPYQPEHTITASVTLPWEAGRAARAGSVTLGLRWESVRYAETANITKLETPLLLDLTVNQQAGDSYTFFAAARNLFNQPYESFDNYYQPGLTLTLGAKVDLQ